jgi:hypothetical protein
MISRATFHASPFGPPIARFVRVTVPPLFELGRLAARIWRTLGLSSGVSRSIPVTRDISRIAAVRIAN